MLPLQCGLGMSVFCEWYHPSILGELDLDVNSQLPKNASFIFSCYGPLTRYVKITPSTWWRHETKQNAIWPCILGICSTCLQPCRHTTNILSDHIRRREEHAQAVACCPPRSSPFFGELQPTLWGQHAQWVHVWTPSWPVHDLHILLCQKSSRATCNADIHKISSKSRPSTRKAYYSGEALAVEKSTQHH